MIIHIIIQYEKSMGSNMPKKSSGYVNVSLPEELARYIEDVIKSGKYGYRTRSEFVVDAVRRRLEELGFYPKKLQ